MFILMIIAMAGNWVKQWAFLECGSDPGWHLLPIRQLKKKDRRCALQQQPLWFSFNTGKCINSDTCILMYCVFSFPYEISNIFCGFYWRTLFAGHIADLPFRRHWGSGACTPGGGARPNYTTWATWIRNSWVTGGTTWINSTGLFPPAKKGGCNQ